MILNVAEVAVHPGLAWKTGKNIDEAFLEVDYGHTGHSGLRILAVDKIAIRKGRQYMTAVLVYETIRVVWMAKGQSNDTLKTFFHSMTKDQVQGLESVTIDMWDPYIKACQRRFPMSKLSSTCPMSGPLLAASSIRCDWKNIKRLPEKIRTFSKAPNTWSLITGLI